MKLLVTTNGRLYKGPDNLYYTPLVYSYDFFKRYLAVFEQLRLVAHVESAPFDVVKDMLCVSGPHIEVFEMPFPHGKIEYLKSAVVIQNKVRDCIKGCDAAMLRVPDPLAFQIFPKLKLLKVPVAVEVTSDPLELYSSASGKYPMRLFVKWSHYFALRQCCRRADGVSYVTKTYLQSVYSSGVCGNNSMRFETYYTDAGVQRHCIERKDIVNRRIRLLHVSGSLAGKVKGHKELVEAFVELRKRGYNVGLTLVGANALDNDIYEILHKSGFIDDVSFTGLLGAEQLNEVYSQSDVFVFPSYREGLPRVVVEAMSWGLPCICTDIPGCRELLDESDLVPLRNVTSLVHKLENLFLSPEQFYFKGQRNLTEAEFYTETRINQKQKDFYLKLRNLVIKKQS